MLFCHTLAAACNDTDIRLLGGRSKLEGRVEVCFRENRIWGTLCDDLWDWRDAMVACRQLGVNPECKRLNILQKVKSLLQCQHGHCNYCTESQFTVLVLYACKKSKVHFTYSAWLQFDIYRMRIFIFFRLSLWTELKVANYACASGWSCLMNLDLIHFLVVSSTICPYIELLTSFQREKFLYTVN